MTRTVQVGSVVRDNEMGKDYVVTGFQTSDGIALVKNDKGYETKIWRWSVHTDGQQRRSGWSLVRE